MKFLLVLIFIITILSLTFAKEIKINSVEESPVIDGIVTPGEWAVSDTATGFIQLEPDKGEPASERTLIHILQNEEYLFIAFICFQDDPASIVANITARDQLSKSDDAVMVLLDTFNDQRSGFAFLVNPLGTQTDLRINDDGRNTDINWDTEWQAAAKVIPEGWSVEIAVPFYKIGYDHNLETWGINFSRIIRQNFETSYWAGTMSQDYRVSQSGILTNLKLPGRDKAFTLTPYTTLRLENSDQTGDENKWLGDIGLDAAYQITSGVVANVTINPDFATVEGDQ